MHFLITNRPNNRNIQGYITRLKLYNVKNLVRVCERTYNDEFLKDAGIFVHDLFFKDGSIPSKRIIKDWFKLLKVMFLYETDEYIAIHCVSGLGRAPLLVVLALLELGMPFEEAIREIRAKKRNALNDEQLLFAESYRPKSRLRLENSKTCSVI
ncbi:hypothetical protein O3M35_004188 [Rhynocoris fuscipes]|uniref:Protein tyrosine phosphatase type IVA 3 n=1 Tax=Rhynocoris fuscipes TaxID=488301 RepID=A0AAW1CGH0_9HEMI